MVEVMVKSGTGKNQGCKKQIKLFPSFSASGFIVVVILSVVRDDL